ncbi:MAG: hypothetical protein WAM95_22145 [Bacillus sp. (in: firmicutes)]
MNLKVKDYEMSKEEIINGLFESRVDNMILNLRIKGLSMLLEEKNVVTKEEIKDIHNFIFNSILEDIKELGVDVENYEAYIRDSLGL